MRTISKLMRDGMKLGMVGIAPPQTNRRSSSSILGFILFRCFVFTVFYRPIVLIREK